jgi:TolA-binding protein
MKEGGMFFGRSCDCSLRVMWAYLLVFSALSWGGAGDMDARREAWRDFGRLLLYRSGTGHCSSAERLSRELDIVDPDSIEAVKTAEAILTEALAGYGQEAIAHLGRIPLDIHPRCILGFHLAERFSGTRLGDWGGRQFDQCVEQACWVVMPVAGDAWRAKLSTEWLAVGETEQGASSMGAFGAGEVPYVYHYLVRNPVSAEARSKARERLASFLWQGYGLTPGLAQHLILLDQGCEVDATWLEVATQLERTGAHNRAKRVYGQILRTTSSGEQAKQAFESLAHILLLESRQKEARAAWGILSQRFPKVECTDPKIKDFLTDSQSGKTETAKRLLEELAKTTNGLRALQLCRLFGALWTPEEAPAQWQMVADKAEPGSLADQLGRIFLARAKLIAGKADESQAAIRGLTESSNPLVQTQSVIVSAEIAQAKGNAEECIRLYSKAVQIDRPTALPPWCKGLLQIESPGAGTRGPELQAQTLLLRGYNDLSDGDYAAAADNLGRVAEDPQRLPDPLRRVLPCMMMLTWLGLEDLVEAEAWGYQALGKSGLGSPGKAAIAAFSSRVQDMDVTISQLLAKARDQAIEASSESTILEDVSSVCEAAMGLGASASPSGAVGNGVQQMYARAKKLLVAHTLEAEYYYITRRPAGSGTKEHASHLDSLWFAAQVLGEESFDRIKENLASLSKADGANDRMYRLAVFAQRTNCPDLARVALEAAASEQASAENVEILQGIAEMYLAVSNHQKAIDAYKRIVANPKNPGKAQTVQLKIIDIYAENLKDYGKAIKECHEFIRRYPGSAQTSQVEFLMGRLSYLGNDYAGAVGQLDGFRTRYPEHAQVGQAMLLAGLSRMAEGNTQEAIGRFKEVIRSYPDGELAARSKFLIGYAQVSEQQYSTALETLKQFIEQFPQSQYVPQAKSLMDRLNKVSR